MLYPIRFAILLFSLSRLSKRSLVPLTALLVLTSYSPLICCYARPMLLCKSCAGFALQGSRRLCRTAFAGAALFCTTGLADLNSTTYSLPLHNTSSNQTSISSIVKRLVVTIVMNAVLNALIKQLKSDPPESYQERWQAFPESFNRVPKHRHTADELLVAKRYINNAGPEGAKSLNQNPL